MLRALGKITPTPGTPVRVSSLLSSGIDPHCHGVLIQAFRANTGYAYVGAAGMNPAANTDLYATLAIPTANTIPSFTAALTFAPNAINLADLWIDVATPGDGVIVSMLVT